MYTDMGLFTRIRDRLQKWRTIYKWETISE